MALAAQPAGAMDSSRPRVSTLIRAQRLVCCSPNRRPRAIAAAPRASSAQPSSSGRTRAGRASGPVPRRPGCLPPAAGRRTGGPARSWPPRCRRLRSSFIPPGWAGPPRRERGQLVLQPGTGNWSAQPGRAGHLRRGTEPTHQPPPARRVAGHCEPGAIIGTVPPPTNPPRHRPPSPRSAPRTGQTGRNSPRRSTTDQRVDRVAGIARGVGCLLQ
jgi:hypothetical protein